MRLNMFSTRTNFLSSRRQQSQNTQKNHSTFIPYIQDTSEKVRRILVEAEVKVTTRPVYTEIYYRSCIDYIWTNIHKKNY